MTPTYIGRFVFVRAAFLFLAVLIVAGGLKIAFGSARPPSPQAVIQAGIRDLAGRAGAGDADARYALALAYENGEGVDRDLPLAARWYAKAAQQGHPDAQYRLGLMYESGEGIKPDYRRAAEWYRRAGGVGRHPGAQFAMGRLFYHGLGTAPDNAAALAWFRRAAMQGHAGSQYLLGEIYQRGWGVERNRVEAYKWFSLAMGHGDRISISGNLVDPAAARAALAPSMNQAEISRAEQAVRDWRPFS